MTAKRISFCSRDKMRAGFARIIQEDPPMKEYAAVHEHLLNFAGMATNEYLACFVLATALTTHPGCYPINLSKHLDVMLDDQETAKKAREVMERISLRMQSKCKV